MVAFAVILFYTISVYLSVVFPTHLKKFLKILTFLLLFYAGGI